MSVYQGICNLSIVPVRSEPSDKGEMVTQLLFGELIKVISEKNSWREIITMEDEYKGWIDWKQFQPLEGTEVSKIKTENPVITFDIVQIATFGKNKMMPLVLGSTLPGYIDKHFSFSGIEFTYEGLVKKSGSPDRSLLIENAFMYLNAPYLWGGRSPFGIDCSGFTQMVYKLSGIQLLRDAWQQAQQGRTLNNLQETLPGDLAFFDNADGKIIHTGILLPDNKIIHASGRVRIDRIDEKGIFNDALQTHTHHLRTLKRM